LNLRIFFLQQTENVTILMMCPWTKTIQALTGLGVSEVVESGHPDFKVGDHIWGPTGWEEYTLIPNPESHFKINHPEIPLSYYTGVLGELIMMSAYSCITTQAKCHLY
jgi:NADPH-dependent curcumin reductase CurA